MTKSVSMAVKALAGTGVIIAAVWGCSVDLTPDPDPGYDSDGDRISNAVETNPPNVRLYAFDPNVPNTNPSVSRGQTGSPPCPVQASCGWIDNAINLPDQHFGYYHYLGTDAVDTDDWGSLDLINEVEAIARKWYMGPFACMYPQASIPLGRMGVGDLSRGYEQTRNFGGSFYPDHRSHQNGLDVDIRFQWDDGREASLNLESADSLHYDAYRSVALMACFLYGGNDQSLGDQVTTIFVDTIYARINTDGETRIVHDVTHRDHFHVRIVDPNPYD